VDSVGYPNLSTMNRGRFLAWFTMNRGRFHDESGAQITLKASGGAVFSGLPVCTCINNLY